ncbi:hypothetical protein RND81_13G055800 [Saponaria officinalis]|uniref:Uncharacterized protein n=1 Tax=Saponaria officinalis TaxID=3572 RepID=A0AAW1GXD9_SAPOF
MNTQSDSSMSTEDMIQALASNLVTLQSHMVQFQQDNRASIKHLEGQVEQIASVINRLEVEDDLDFNFSKPQTENVSDYDYHPQLMNDVKQSFRYFDDEEDDHELM